MHMAICLSDMQEPALMRRHGLVYTAPTEDPACGEKWHTHVLSSGLQGPICT